MSKVIRAAKDGAIETFTDSAWRHMPKHKYGFVEIEGNYLSEEGKMPKELQSALDAAQKASEAMGAELSEVTGAIDSIGESVAQIKELAYQSRDEVVSEAAQALAEKFEGVQKEMSDAQKAAEISSEAANVVRSTTKTIYSPQNKKDAKVPK
jgi:archaellum component FlaC